MKIKNKIITFIMFIAGLVVFVPKVYAAQVTVCASGCDFTTIQAAIDASTVTSGSTITVRPGSYEGFTGPASKILVIKGEGAVNITSNTSIGGTGKTTINGLAFGSNSITVTSGNVVLKNNVITRLIVEGTAVANAEYNYWGSENPLFNTIITKASGAQEDHDPYYKALKNVGSNIISISQTKIKTELLVSKTISALTEMLSITGDGYTENIIWRSSNERIAVVNDLGVITGIAEGKTNITATTSYGDVYTFEITVVCEENPKTSREWYLVGFIGLALISSYMAISTYKKNKQLS